MAITYAGRANTNFSTSAVPNLAVTLNSTVAGNLLVVCVTSYALGSAAPSISVSDGTAFTLAVSATGNPGGGADNYRHSIFYRIGGGGNITVTATFSPSAYSHITITEYAGASATVDITGATAHIGTTSNIFTLTTSAPTDTADLCVSSCYITTGSPAMTTTYGTTVNAAIWSGNLELADQYKIGTGTSAQSIAWNAGGSHFGMVLAATFKPSAGGGITGTGALVARHALAAGTGTYTPAAITGTAALVARHALAAATGTYTPEAITGTGALVARHALAAATGTYSAAGITGTGALVARHALAAGTGTYTPAAITGTAALVARHAIFHATGTGGTPTTGPHTRLLLGVGL